MALLVKDRPPAMMLKDFLRVRDDYNQYYSCSSSNDFQIYPRKKTCKSTPAPASTTSNKSNVLLRSLSKKAAATKISAVHKVINAVKFLQFVKSPLTVLLPRRLANDDKKKKLQGTTAVMSPEGAAGKQKVKIKVKDILRLTSFSDMDDEVEDESTPLEYPSSSSPSRTATTTSSCGKRSSWRNSDFTAEDLPFWGCENATLLRNTKAWDWSIEECEQQSPVSVLDSPFRGPISPFHPTLVNFERTKSFPAATRRIQELESIVSKVSLEEEISISKGLMMNAGAHEEKAKQLLLSHVKEDNQSQQANYKYDHMILDFFMHELSINGNLHDIEFHDEILRFAKSWTNNGEYDEGESYEWEVEDKREAYVKDIEKGVSWNKFKQEQEDISIEFEVRVLDELIDQVLIDFLIQMN